MRAEQREGRRQLAERRDRTFDGCFRSEVVEGDDVVVAAETRDRADEEARCLGRHGVRPSQRAGRPGDRVGMASCLELFEHKRHGLGWEADVLEAREEVAAETLRLVGSAARVQR